MTFFRPEAVRAVLRWAETSIWGALTLAALFWMVAGAGWSGWPRWIAGAGLVAAGLWLTRSAAVSALAARAEDAPGVVEIDERRITYLGPHDGGAASLNDVHTVVIWPPDPAAWRYGTEWILHWSDTEPALIVPASAKGADGLIDACAALPGFSPTRAVAALGAKSGAPVTIWRRDTAPARPALAP